MKLMGGRGMLMCHILNPTQELGENRARALRFGMAVAFMIWNKVLSSCGDLFVLFKNISII